MNFTREPIIETVITPREGCKLAIRSSKGLNQEDYLVDAIEVVSFGHSFFFRSQERPKSFLVPISDYEILEVKEARLALKNASPDKSIKISGGRDAPPRPPREMQPPESEEEFASLDRGYSAERPPERPPERMGKRDRSRRRGRRGRDRVDAYPQQQQQSSGESFPSGQEGAPFAPPHEPAPESNRPGEEQKAPSFISKLFPPPSMLIKETLGRYKLPDPSAEDISSLSSGESSQDQDDPFSEPPYLPEGQKRSREETDAEEEE